MPKVVDQNKLIYRRYTCKHCDAINEVVPNEIRTLYKGKDYSGGTAGSDGFNCALCGKVLAKVQRLVIEFKIM